MRTCLLSSAVAFFLAAGSGESFAIEVAFGPAVHLGPTINGPGNERNPWLSPDGLSVFFDSDWASGDPGNTNIWWAARESLAEPFGTAQLLVGVNSDRNDGGPSLTPDGLTIYFHSNREGSKNGSLDLWTATRPSTAESFGTPVQVPSTGLHGTSTEATPFFWPQQSEIYFASNRERPLDFDNLFDLFVSTWSAAERRFATPVKLPNVNTDPYNEQSPSLSADGLMLFFHSDRPGGVGGADLFVATRSSVNDPFGEVVSLGPTINTSYNDRDPFLTTDGRWLVFSSDRPGGYGLGDLWMAPVLTTLVWNESGSGAWSGQHWRNGHDELVAPAGGEAMLILAGQVEVDDHRAFFRAASSLDVAGEAAALRVAEQAALEVLGTVAVSPGASLTVDGVLRADEVVIAGADPAGGGPSGVLGGAGTIVASRVVIGGVLSPGSLLTNGGLLPGVGDSAGGAAAAAVPAPWSPEPASVPEPASLRILLAVAAAWTWGRRRARRHGSRSVG